MADTLFVDQVTTVPSAWLQALNDKVYKGRDPNFVTSTGSANAQVITLPSSLYATPQNGDTFVFKAGFTNTLAATLKVVGASSTGVLALQYKGVALSGGEILVNTLTVVTYLNGTWQLLSNYASTSAAAISFAAYSWITSANVQLAFQEVVDDLAGDSSAGLGAALVGYKNGATNSVLTTLHNRLKGTLDGKADFGIVADGVTDDTTALQNAINAAISTKKSLQLPTGTIRTTGVVTVNSATGLIVCGQGRNSTIVKGEFTGNAVFHFNSSGGVPSSDTLFANMTIHASGYNTSSIKIEYHANQIRNLFYNCLIYGDMNGNTTSVFKSSASGFLNIHFCEIAATNASAWALELADYNQNSQLTGVEITNVGNGMRITYNSTRVEGTRLDNCLILCTGSKALQVNNSLLTVLTNCTIDQFADIGIEIEASANSVQMHGGWIGINSAGGGSTQSNVYIHEDSGDGHIFNGVEIAFAKYGIEFKAAGSVHVCPMQITNCSFQGNLGSGAKAAIRFDSVTRVVVSNNVDRTNESAIATNYNGTYEVKATIGNNAIQFSNNLIRPKGGGGAYVYAGTNAMIAINEAGTGARIQAIGQQGVVAASSGNIAHGLIAAPSYVILSMERSAGTGIAVHVTSKDATNIAWASDASFTGTIDWLAIVV